MVPFYSFYTHEHPFEIKPPASYADKKINMRLFYARGRPVFDSDLDCTTFWMVFVFCRLFLFSSLWDFVWIYQAVLLLHSSFKLISTSNELLHITVRTSALL